MAKQSKTNETTQKILQHLFSDGVFPFRCNSTGIFDRNTGSYRAATKKGISDILACWNSVFVAIEVKTPPDKPSQEQLGFLSSVTHAGGIAFIAHDYDHFKEQWSSIINNPIWKKKTQNNP